jgi:hypothetical protein
MHHLVRTSLLIAIMSVGSSTNAHAQAAAIGSQERQQLFRQAAKDLILDLEKIRSALIPGVKDTDLPIVNSVKFRVPDNDTDDTINCFAGQEADGTRVVYVGLGFSRALAMFIDAELLAKELNNPAKGQQYIDYIRTRWKENLDRGRRGLDPVFVQSPYEYFHVSDQMVHKIELNSNRLYSGALAFAVAHEMGHQIRKHDVRSPVHPLEEEEAADNWAMETMITAGMPPTAGIMTMTFYSSFFADDPSHPKTNDRELSMIRQTLANLDRFSERARANGVSIEAYREQLRAALQQLTEP